MNLLSASLIFNLLSFFGVLFVLVLYKKTKQQLEKREQAQKQKTYQISILKEIQDRIGYSLDIEKIADVITGSLKHLFPYSTTSSMVIKNDKLIFKTNLEAPVSFSYIQEVKKFMFASFQALSVEVPLHMDEQINGVPVDEGKTSGVGSFFNIPLAIGNDVIGLINVSSTSKSLYTEEEITILYQIVAQASNALSRLTDVLTTEKGKLTAMIGSLADGVFMVDTNKNLMIINNAAKSFLGLSGKNAVFLDILSAIGTNYPLHEKIDEAVKTNSLIEDKEVNINQKIFQVFITPVAKVGASILLHDITLDREISTIKEDFTHMIVHELRAPLTAIKDSSELMIEVFEEKGKLEREQQKKLLEIIDLQAKNLLEQINQVLDAAKIEAGSFSIQKKPEDIGVVIQNSIEPFIPQATKKQILITTDVYYPLPKVDIDSIRINQVLNNLISNSLKFTSPGGKITISAKPEKSDLIVSVTDTGMGIAETDQKDMFSKYYQIRTTPGQLSKKGTGLGLYITKGIVESHGGTVGVKSKLGEGTTIFFTLPFEGGEPQIVQGHLPKPSVSSMVN